MQMRKKKDKQNLSFIVLVFLLTTPLWAQDQQQSERSYYETLAAVKQQQSKLGSLNTTLADFAKEIDVPLLLKNPVSADNFIPI